MGLGTGTVENIDASYITSVGVSSSTTVGLGKVGDVPSVSVGEVVRCLRRTVPSGQVLGPPTRSLT